MVLPAQLHPAGPAGSCITPANRSDWERGKSAAVGRFRLGEKEISRCISYEVGSINLPSYRNYTLLSWLNPAFRTRSVHCSEILLSACPQYGILCTLTVRMSGFCTHSSVHFQTKAQCCAHRAFLHPTAPVLPPNAPNAKRKGYCKTITGNSISFESFHKADTAP